jgi:hypothetical protein
VLEARQESPARGSRGDLSGRPGFAASAHTSTPAVRPTALSAIWCIDALLTRRGRRGRAVISERLCARARLFAQLRDGGRQLLDIERFR